MHDRAQIEGCIAQGYIHEECVNFCVRYMTVGTSELLSVKGCSTKMNTYKVIILYLSVIGNENVVDYCRPYH